MTAVNLTDAGRLFLKEACTVLERIDEAVRKTLRLTLRSLRETKLILRFRSLQRIHHRIRILLIHLCQREIIFLKQPNRFQISWAHFCFDRLQFHLFNSKLNDPWNYFLHAEHISDFSGRRRRWRNEAKFLSPLFGGYPDGRRFLSYRTAQR